MIAFLIKIVICSSLLYGLYYLLLRKETFFCLNRIFLLATLTLSILIPTIQISLPFSRSNIAEIFFYNFVNGTKDLFFVYLLDEVIIYGKASPFSWPNIIEKIYYIGIFVFSIKIFIFLYQIALLHIHSKKHTIKGINLYVHNRPYTAFSFWKNIYVHADELHSDKFKVIWKHEIEHIKQGHTIESFLLEIWCCLFWFNPFFWAIKRKLKDIHEYQVDSNLIRKGMNTVVYQQHLLNYTLSGHSFNAASHFAASALKNRISMLARNPSTIWNKSRVTLAIPIVVLLVFAFSFDFNKTTNIQSFEETTIPLIDSLTNDSIPILIE